MDLDAYVAEHDGEWRRLDQLAARHRLSATEVDELVILYQRAATHLSVIRSRQPDAALVARLSRIVLAARAGLTGSRGFRLADVGRFFAVTFPVAVYRAWPWWCAVATTFTVLSFVLMGYVAQHPDVQRAFMSDYAIDDLVNRDFAAYYREYAAQNFAFEVWTNNLMVAGICLASGVLVIPVIYMLFNEVLRMGIMGGVMIGHGKGDVFFGLIVPHGLLELTCVFVAAGVGLRIAWAWIAPPPGRTRGRSLAEAARTGMTVALGLCAVLLVSGVIEAFVTPSALHTIARIGIGVVAFVGFLAYVGLLGARGVATGETGDLDAAHREAETPAL